MFQYMLAIGPLKFGSRDQIFAQKIYIMGYNLKNARNGKSIAKILKLQSLKPLPLKSKFIQQFEFSENLEDICVKCCWRARSCSPTTFSIQTLIF